MYEPVDDLCRHADGPVDKMGILWGCSATAPSWHGYYLGGYLPHPVYKGKWRGADSNRCISQKRSRKFIKCLSQCDLYDEWWVIKGLRRLARTLRGG